MIFISDKSTSSIADAARSVLVKKPIFAVYEDTSDVTGQHGPHYESLASMATTAMQNAEKTQNAQMYRKASALHRDAANETSPSSSDKLFSESELNHLAQAKYCDHRADGMTPEEATQASQEYIRELSNHTKVRLGENV
jgi:hypothetical protein